ncbi:diacylglycerol kinase family lipid kinase [Polycladomyces sp. WAk]|uniref:Diacylglycerol kinase family lipid kinase n=2 Tax=Polycladomyces zharkentensis TaxID=2807616 RepID=A0ABS2WIS5_9BACL|nr:diacylglycerol kinase family lipid kinase [Polycladomyces sp. WAk]
MYIMIVNPVSGNGRGRKVWERVSRLLKKEGLPYRVYFTTGRGHATVLSRQAVESPQVKAVVAIGGDGTVHEVGNALVDTNVPLGYLPAGSGNDFAVAHRIPLDPLKAWERVLHGRSRAVDTARIGERFMIGFMGIGFDAAVAKRVNDSRWKRFGKFVYAGGVLREWARFQPVNVRITMDGTLYDLDRVWLIAAAHIPNYAGGMQICPGAEDDDGRLDICCVRDVTRRDFLRLFPSVYRGTHVDQPFIVFRRAKQFTVSSEIPLLVHADGEVIGQTPIAVTVLPQSLKVL